MPMAARSAALASPRRLSRSSAPGRSDQAASSAAAAAAAPRRVSGGGLTSSTTAPGMPCQSRPVAPLLQPIWPGALASAPGSRSSTRSPTCSGSGSRSVSLASAGAEHPDPGRSSRGTHVHGDRPRLQRHHARSAGRPQPHVDLPGQDPPAWLHQRHAAANIGPVDAAQVQRGPGHAGQRGSVLAERLQRADPDRPHRRSEEQLVAPADRAGGQRSGHDGAAASDAERAVDPDPHRCAAGRQPAAARPARRAPGQARAGPPR